MRHLRFVSLLVSSVVLAALAPARAAAPAAAPTPAEAKAFIEGAESKLLDLWIAQQRAAWVYSTFITDDTETIQAEANQKVIDETV